MNKKERTTEIRSIALCALFAVLIVAGAFIKIPVGVVPQPE